MTWTIWTGLGIGVAAVLAALGFLVVRVLQAWRDFKRFRRHLARELARVAELAERTAEKAAQAGDQTRLNAHLDRLRATLAQFAVLRSALDEAAGVAGRVTAVYPRK